MDYSLFLEKAEKNLFIIAEAGVNHNGDIRQAFRLVDAAIEAGCDAVKFQTWLTEKVYSKDRSIKPEYQQRTTDTAESEFETIKKLELAYEEFVQIKEYCDKRKIMFLSTPDEVESANFLSQLGVGLMKTASQDVTNLPFLKHIAQLDIPVIFSTGACTLAELASGVEVISTHNKRMIILHCVSAYPAPMDEMNISVIPNLKKMFGFPVGLSDHTSGTEVACAAVALGARIFEKHITLDKSMEGPDHQASLIPEEMHHYCQVLREVHNALGDGVKRIMPSEVNNRKAFRRFPVAAHDLPVGSILQVDDLCFKKVVNGIAPEFMDLVIGAELSCNIEADAVLTWQMLRSRG